MIELYDNVRKRGNGYPYIGEVIGLFTKDNGQEMANVESFMHPSMVMVFPVANLETVKTSKQHMIVDYVAWLFEKEDIPVEALSKVRRITCQSMV